jgi:hypothetical protein
MVALSFNMGHGFAVALMWLVAAAQPLLASPSPQDLHQLVSLFPHGEVVVASGRRSLAVAMGEALQSIVRGSAGGEPEIAFVVDLSHQGSLGAELQLALAAHRDKLLRGHYALVLCGENDGEAKAVVEVPLNADSYGVLRAARRTSLRADGAGVEASGLGLAAASRLDWRPGGAPPQIVLLAAEAEAGDLSTTAASKPANRKTLAEVATWARSRQAALFAIDANLAERDGRGDDASEDSLEQRARVSLRQVAGLVRDGRHVQVASPGELTSAIADALARAASDGKGAEVALLVDSSGLMGEAVTLVRDSQGTLAQFVALPRRRLAFVQFRGKGPPAIVLPLTGEAKRVARAARGLRRGEVGDWPKDLSAVLATARQLRWDKASKKALILLTAADAGGGLDPAVLDWAEEEQVALTVIEPLPALTGSRRRAR